jgi:hypothetical protein
MTEAGWRVGVRGSLRVTDLRRFERACGPALERHPLSLELDVGALQSMDEPARRFIQCLLRRGAALIGAGAGRWQTLVAADEGTAGDHPFLLRGGRP